MSQPAFDFGDEMPEDVADPTYTVGELAAAINHQLQRSFSDGVWVRGEISGLQDRGPHTYFSLIEDGDSGKAVMNVQLFAPAKARLAPMLRKFRLELRNGMKVRHSRQPRLLGAGRSARLSRWPDLDPKYTIGDIAQSRDDVVRRLAAEGLMDTNKRHPMSPVPLRVGVVTSVGTAAWHDFHDELARNQFGFRLVVADVRVQGDLAENMIIGGISQLAMLGTLDVIVVIRGGGARNELAVFDSERIARTIANSPVPVLTGLGHEVDRSVADEVAYLALKTPTAVAGELLGRVAEYTANTEQTFAAIVQRSTVALSNADSELSEVGHRIARRTHAAVERADERLSMRVDRLGRGGPAVLERAAGQLDRVALRIIERPTEVLDRAGQRLDVMDARVSGLDPAVQIGRGWTITRDAAGVIVRSVADIAPHDIVTTTLIDGTVTSTVTASGPTVDSTIINTGTNEESS